MDINEYNEIMEALDELELNDEIEEDNSEPVFRFEYAHESVTERWSVYKRRMSYV